MGWVSYYNYAKEKGEKSWINSRWTWFIGKSGNKNINLQVTSTPSFGWGMDIDGCESDVTFRFWFIFKFYLSFERIFPKWVYTKEYNEFADKDNKPNKNKVLRGRAKNAEKGWIRTGKRELSLSFHHYSMWWNIWTDGDSWSSKIPRWRRGSFDFVRLLKGKDKVSNETVFSGIDEIEMPEGKYKCKIEFKRYTRTYQRWPKQVWNRFAFEFGYENEKGEWIQTPIPHWGKGENSWDCGMDGTYSISLGSEVKNLDEAKIRVVESCLKDRKKYGKVDFSKVSGIENGYIKANLIGQF